MVDFMQNKGRWGGKINGEFLVPEVYRFPKNIVEYERL